MKLCCYGFSSTRIKIVYWVCRSLYLGEPTNTENNTIQNQSIKITANFWIWGSNYLINSLDIPPSSSFQLNYKKQGHLSMNFYSLEIQKCILELINLSFYLDQAKAGLRQARPRLDNGARIQFKGVLNVSLRTSGSVNDPKTLRDQPGAGINKNLTHTFSPITGGPN